MAKFATGTINYEFDDLPIYILKADGTKQYRLVEGEAEINYSASTYQDEALGEAWEIDYTIDGLSNLSMTDYAFDQVADTVDHHLPLVLEALDLKTFDIECQILEEIED